MAIILLAGGCSGRGSDPRIALDFGTVWSTGDAVYWTSLCATTYPPEYRDEVRVDGIDDITALHGLTTEGDFSWTEDVSLVGRFEKSTSTLILTEPAREAPPRPDFHFDWSPPCDATGRNPTDVDVANLSNYGSAQPDTFGGLWVADGKIPVLQFTDLAGHSDHILSFYDGPFCLLEVSNSLATVEVVQTKVREAREEIEAAGIVSYGLAFEPRGTFTRDGFHQGPVLAMTVFLADREAMEFLHSRFDPDVLQVVPYAEILN